MHYPNVLYIVFLLLTAKYIIHLYKQDPRIEEDAHSEEKHNPNNEQIITAEETTHDERYYGDSESDETNDNSYRKRTRTISLHDRLMIHEVMNQ